MAHDFIAPDGRARCQWCSGAAEFLPYHDQEWGFPVSDDQRLFEKLCLESFQSGLSWRTILNKRENFRAAFHHKSKKSVHDIADTRSYRHERPSVTPPALRYGVRGGSLSWEASTSAHR